MYCESDFYSDPIFVFTKLCSTRRSSVKFAARADLWNFFGAAGMLFPPHAQMKDVSKVLRLQETVTQYYI